MSGPREGSRERLLAEAQEALERTDWRAAARSLEEAAEVARLEGDGARAAHCLQMAATLHRATGDGARAVATARRGEGLDAGARGRFANLAEAGEALMARGSWKEAEEAYGEALEAAAPLELPDWARATVMRRRAEASAAAGGLDGAWTLYDEAAGLMSEGSSAAWVDLEHARAALRAGEAAHARKVLGRERVRRRLAADAHLRSEVLLVEAGMAARDGRLGEAARCAGDAREAALSAVSPLSYLGAAATLARVADARDRRLEAYTVLATAWVTLGDLLGGELAESWVGPILTALRARWGEEAFREVKEEHDDRRRAAQASGDPHEGGEASS